jgi:hypothetical protein
MTYLRSHGELDQQHVHDLYGILDRLEEEQDRAALERCARVMFRLYGSIFRELDAASISSAEERAA